MSRPHFLIGKDGSVCLLAWFVRRRGVCGCKNCRYRVTLARSFSCQEMKEGNHSVLLLLPSPSPRPSHTVFQLELARNCSWESS